MKILVVSSYLPYPLLDGGRVRLYNLMKLLSQNHEITLVCEKRSNQTAADIAEVKKVCKVVYTVDRKKQWSIKHVLSASISSYPFLLVGHTHPEMQNMLKELLKKESFDLIHVETFYVYQNLPETNLPVVLVEHNIEYLVYQRFLDVLPKAFLPLAPFLLLDIKKIKKWEEYYWGKATKLVAVSEDEKKMMKRGDIVVVPNGVDINKFKIKKSQSKIEEEKRILFIGNFKWLQNRDAVEFILKEVWPKINGKWKIENGKLQLWIVGKQIPDSLKKLVSDSKVLFDEHAPEETEKIYHAADVLLAPIRVGGGTSYKILEAMSCGTAVVTTPLGIEGIAEDGKAVAMIGNTGKELAERTIEVLTDEKTFDRITTNARRLVEEKYSWEEISKKLDEVYESLAVYMR